RSCCLKLSGNAGSLSLYLVPLRSVCCDRETALELRFHAGEARRVTLSASRADELRKLRPLAERARAIGIRVPVDGGEAGRRLTLLDPRLQRFEAVDLRVERTETVAEAGNHVEAHEAVDAGLAELLHLPFVIQLRVVRRDEVVGRAMRHDDLAALRLELLEAHVGHIHDRCDRCNARLPADVEAAHAAYWSASSR